jgi:kumamolisin
MQLLRADRKRVPHTATALTPLRVAKAYNFPQGVDVSKRTVAILELGGAFNLSDVVAYCNRYGFKVPRITTVFVDGAAEQSDPQGADGEVCLDIDVIAAVAQGCHIAVVFAPNSDKGFIDGVKACLDLDPDAISISWGSPEDGWAPESRAALDALFQAAEEKGINVFAAAGDNGSGDGEMFGAHTDYPASSPFVIACGGTHLELAADGTRQLETAWSNGGGGISAAYNSTPNWQQGTASALQSGRRVPDVSGNADPNTGYEVDIDGQLAQIGGTSAVAPLMAAYQVLLNALKNQHVGNMHTKMYGATQSFFDVTLGGNGAFVCTPGFDCVTGIGVVNGTEFAQAVAT